MKRGEMPFLDHLEELRWRILWSLLAVALLSGVGFLLVHYLGVMQLLITPLRDAYQDDQMRLIYLSPTDGFFITLKLALMVGLILASPVVIYQIWAFLSPALDSREKKVIVPSLYLGLVLFAMGVALAYFIALPISLIFLRGFQIEFLEAAIEVNFYLSFVTRLLIAFGVVFELPVVTMILTALGLTTPTFLASKRRHAIVLITVLASFLSPGDVVAVTVLLMVPLIILYEVSIVLSRVIYKRRHEDDEDRTIGPPPGAVEAG